MDKAALTTVVITAMTNAASGTTVTLFEEGAAWKSAVDNNFTTIDFADGENHAFINDDYAHLGVTFSSNAHYIFSGLFVNDDWGMRANGGAWLTFDTPQHWIAVEHPGNVIFQLYHKGEVIYTSPILGGSGLGFFSGLVSSQAFDQVYLMQDWENIVAVDDLHFGTFVPGPGGLALLTLAGFAGRSRRRA